MPMKTLNGHPIHYADEGPRDGKVLVFANSLGTDFRLWDRLLPYLPEGLRIIRYDKRGHGLSGGPNAPYFMGDLVLDLAALLDHLELRDVALVGLSIGGMIAQGLAAERPDLVRVAVFSNTGARIGNEAIWDDRLAAVAKGGVAALADATMTRWFSDAFRNSDPDEVARWHAMMCRTWIEGYTGCAHAIRDTDLFDSTARLTLPVLGIAGSEDGSTPPDMVRETAGLVAGSAFHLIRGAGHLPCVEAPEAYATALTGFLKDSGYL